MSVRIANKALRRIHAAPISALDGLTEVKRTVQDEMDCAVDYVLRKNPYTEVTAMYCPSAAQALDASCDLPVGFKYAFHLPRDYLRAKRVDPANSGDKCGGSAIQWRMVKHDGCTVLVTDYTPVKLEYVCRPDNLDGLPPDIWECIYLRLAMGLVAPLQADKALRQEIRDELREAEAIAANNSEEHDQTDTRLDDLGELVDARLCVWGGARGYGRG